jgi:hypothetical protein
MASRTIGVDLRLLNEGTAPASGIEVRIGFPDDVCLGEDMYSSADPTEPMLPKFFQSAWVHSLFGSYSSGKDLERRLKLVMPCFGGNGVEVEGLRDHRWHLAGNVLTTSVKRLLHKRHVELTQFPVTFPLRDQELAGFAVHAVILVADPADEMEGSLSFVPSSVAR